MSFIDKTNIVIKKNNNDLYYFDIDKDIVLTKINNKKSFLYVYKWYFFLLIGEKEISLKKGTSSSTLKTE